MEVDGESKAGGRSTRMAAIARVLDETARRRAEGEDIADEVVISKLGDVMPELAEQLELLRRLDEAELRARQSPESAEASEAATTMAIAPTRVNLVVQLILLIVRSSFYGATPAHKHPVRGRRLVAGY